MCVCASNPEYPPKELYRFLPQEILTLPFLHNCFFYPKLSAYALFRGIFDYNKTPLAPIGARFLVHEKTTNCHTWEPHGAEGWYIGPDLERYQCVEYYIPSIHIT